MGSRSHLSNIKERKRASDGGHTWAYLTSTDMFRGLILTSYDVIFNYVGFFPNFCTLCLCRVGFFSLAKKNFALAQYI